MIHYFNLLILSFFLIIPIYSNEEINFNEIDHSLMDYDLTISRRFNHLKLGILTTWNKKCGIALYMRHIFNAMTEKGLIPIILSHDLPPQRILDRAIANDIDILNIQYEPSLFSDEYIRKLVKTLRANNIKVVITVHWEREILKKIEKYVDLFLYHKLPTLNIKKFSIVPMGVPVFEPTENRDSTRLRYNYNKDDIIITTTGFLLTWKEYSLILEKLASYIKLNPKIKVQFLTSFNDITKDECQNELNKINNVIEKYSLHNQVKVVTKFIPQVELSERLWISDLGYLWGGMESKGSSASMKEFISARLPLITTKCSHFSDINKGVIKTEIDKDLFVTKLTKTLNNNQKLNNLKNELEDLYIQLNYNNLIDEYIKIFKDLNDKV